MKRRTSLIGTVAGVILLLVVAGVTVFARSGVQAAAVPTTLTYQGHLLDDAGDPVVDGPYSMSFSLWDDAATGAQVWGPEAQANVQVTDGFFAVLLGETSPIAASVLQTTTYLEIVVGGETLDPRQQLGAVAFALQAESVPWTGVTGKPSTYSPSTHTHPWADVTGEPAYTTRWPTWAEVTSKPSTFTPSTHTHGSDDIDAYADLSASGRLNNDNGSDLLTRSQADARYEIPAGGIIMWSGSIGSIPSGWALCDGSNGTPDLTNRFVVGAGGTYGVGDTGGVVSHTLTIDEMPSHNHGGTTSTNGAHTHDVRGYDQGTNPDRLQGQGKSSGGWRDAPGAALSAGAHSHTISSQGGGQPHENRPPYYALAYIMKLP